MGQEPLDPDAWYLFDEIVYTTNDCSGTGWMNAILCRLGSETMIGY